MKQDDKIYFNIHTAKYNHKRHNEDDVEYTRTDAFIKRACEYALQHILVMDSEIENFKNYMKGEHDL